MDHILWQFVQLSDTPLVHTSFQTFLWQFEGPEVTFEATLGDEKKRFTLGANDMINLPPGVVFTATVPPASDPPLSLTSLIQRPAGSIGVMIQQWPKQ